MHLLVQHPSLLMTEHGKEGDGGVVMHASYPKLLQIFKRKNTQKKQKVVQAMLSPLHSHKMFNRKTKPVSYLFDMTHLSNYWGCDGKPARV